MFASHLARIEQQQERIERELERSAQRQERVERLLLSLARPDARPDSVVAASLNTEMLRWWRGRSFTAGEVLRWAAGGKTPGQVAVLKLLRELTGLPEDGELSALVVGQRFREYPRYFRSTSKLNNSKLWEVLAQDDEGE
ncbi:MAG: hypothetical protein MUC68_02975 [Burkholderiaceae bacterium]|nr:hypothetical protein [Burkholderiaceae bacterium]